MGLSPKTLFLANIILIFNALYIPALGEIGCPPEEDITPCKCTHRRTAILRCSSIRNAEDIDLAFRHSKGYTYEEVHFENFLLKYIPSRIFVNTTVKELYVVNLTLVTLFDLPPESNSLLKLRIENTAFQRFPSQNLSNFANLEHFYIDSVEIGTLTSTYTDYLPGSLKRLIFVRAGIRAIKKDAFTKFVNLEELVVRSNEFGNDVTRDCLPRPSNVQYIYAIDNQMTSLPADAFHDMPDLEVVSLKDNKLKEFPKSAFDSTGHTLTYLNLDGNPISCDCQLLWLIEDKPEFIRGSCETPSRLKGRALKTLTPGDFNCPS